MPIRRCAVCLEPVERTIGGSYRHSNNLEYHYMSAKGLHSFTTRYPAALISLFPNFDDCCRADTFMGSYLNVVTYRTDVGCEWHA